MIERQISLPTNRHITAKRDRRWPLAFSLLGLLSLALALTLALVGWPRLHGISLNYDLVRLRAEVEGLQLRTLDLETRLECLRSPGALAERASDLGLEPAGPEVMRTDGEKPR